MSENEPNEAANAAQKEAEAMALVALELAALRAFSEEQFRKIHTILGQIRADRMAAKWLAPVAETRPDPYRTAMKTTIRFDGRDDVDE